MSLGPGSLSSITRLALYDELVKISESTGAQRRRQAVKWLKGTTAVAAGTGVGTGLYHIGQKGAEKLLGKKWAALSPTIRRSLLTAGAGAAGIGSAALAHRLMKAKREYES